MKIKDKSEWFIISWRWFEKWKEYVNFENDSEIIERNHPGMIGNNEILEDSKYVLHDNQRQHLNINLKENLKEETDYMIINEKMWKFLATRYGGVEIKRFGIRNEEDKSKSFIEVNLIKLYVHYFPSQMDESIDLYIVYESRYSTVEQLKERLADIKRKDQTNVRLWKASIPKQFNEFYQNNLKEYQMDGEIKIDGELLKQRYSKIVDINISMDDFIIVEWKWDSKFIFILEESKNDVAKTAIKSIKMEEVKIKLENYDPLRFLKIDLRSMFHNNSNQGLCGLSNLGNTWFMNSALQWLSNTTELTKYFISGWYINEINYENPLGTQGQLVNAYAKLIKDIWFGYGKRVAPWDIKKAIGAIAPQFQGFTQQDSFELLNYVVDTLHEDLNRVIEKPITEPPDSNDRPDYEVSGEYWSCFKQRNNSVIVDLMYGQLKSRLICGVCK